MIWIKELKPKDSDNSVENYRYSFISPNMEKIQTSLNCVICAFLVGIVTRKATCPPKL